MSLDGRSGDVACLMTPQLSASPSLAHAVTRSATSKAGPRPVRRSPRRKIGMESTPYVSDLMLGLGGWVGGSAVGSGGAEP